MPVVVEELWLVEDDDPPPCVEELELPELHPTLLSFENPPLQPDDEPVVVDHCDDTVWDELEPIVSLLLVP